MDASAGSSSGTANEVFSDGGIFRQELGEIPTAEQRQPAKAVFRSLRTYSMGLFLCVA